MLKAIKNWFNDVLNGFSAYMTVLFLVGGITLFIDGVKGSNVIEIVIGAVGFIIAFIMIRMFYYEPKNRGPQQQAE